MLSGARHRSTHMEFSEPPLRLVASIVLFYEREN